MPCLGTDTLLALASDRSPDRLARFEAHLDECAECRALIGELAELSWMRVARTQPDGDTCVPLGIGSVVDRYIVLDTLGAGAMGIVYAAYDPRLDRKIALKVLRDEHRDDERLQREAQTLARLRHPNVVAVHDTGRCGERVFVAMELVAGMTLRQWLHNEHRSWREIADIFVQAGLGLGAAHAAGIVHRDFKPDNVLIGLDGRAQVADFGLARSGDLPVDDIAGTPAYMAPEQRRGEAVSEQSDQYSFCIALHEALLGRRPAQPALPAVRHVPKRILAAIQRGMHDDPARRFTSMDDLIRALRAPSPVVPALLATSIAACVMLAAFGMTRTAHGQVAPPCSGAASAIAGVWNASTRELLRMRFVATGRADAAQTFAAVEQRLDQYANDWGHERKAACSATQRGEQSHELLDQRMACLDLRLGELATRVDILHEVSLHTLRGTPALIDALALPAASSSRAAVAGQSSAPASGQVSTFDDGTLASRFGAGWSASTDSFMGGRSTATLANVEDALAITGTVEQASSPIAWAGAMFSPGNSPMAPADLSAFRAVTFSARGDGAIYEVLLFSQSKGDLPSFRLFEAKPTWTRYRFALADFDGVNPGDIKGLLFASNRAGSFALQIDDVRFE